MPVIFSEEQQFIIEKFKLGENIFITGPGGTGKSFLIKYLVSLACENSKKIKVCALTGCAAILLECNATTLHSFSGIGLAKKHINEVVDSVVSSKKKRKNWNNLDILIIDEVSMLSLKLLDIIDMIAKRVTKKRELPFGGIQIVFSGDFYQLPPVGDDDPESCQFCFESQLWNQLFKPENQIEATKIFRQTDKEYVKILNKLRVGKISNNGINTLKQCTQKNINKANPTIILPRKNEADRINQYNFNKLDSKEEYEYNIKGVPLEELPISKEQKEAFDNSSDYLKKESFDQLKNSLIVEHNFKLRIGTKVMCIINMDVSSEFPIVNGSQGEVIEFKDGFPIVKFKNGYTNIIRPHVWSSDILGAVAIKQLPLIYSWAITIHKAQGITLDEALIDVGSGIFECGQSYVALSRVKSLDGLYLKNFDANKIKVNKKVKDFYTNLQLTQINYSLIHSCKC